MGKHKKYQRAHAHSRLFTALSAASEPVDASSSSESDSESACNEPARSEPFVSADEYYRVAKNVVENQETLFQEGGGVNVDHMLHAIQALSLAAQVYSSSKNTEALEDANAFIIRARQLIRSAVQERVSSDSIILRPRPPAPAPGR